MKNTLNRLKTEPKHTNKFSDTRLCLLNDCAGVLYQGSERAFRIESS